MTLIAGIVSRREDRSVPLAMSEALRRSLSRHAGDEVVVFEFPHAFFVKLDIGAFMEKAEISDEDGLTLLAGEPLFGITQNRTGRDVDTRLLHDDVKTGNLNVLRTANGVFNAVHYNADRNELTLITDKLGIRPLYYFISDDYVIFAGALRVLEEIAEIPKVMDVRAVTEMVGLGYALADRTPYTAIKLLRAGEIMRVIDTGIGHEQYWRWDDSGTSERSEEHLLGELYSRFTSAVARRNCDDKTTVAYLSGGLDSRCIVAGLRDQGLAVHTFNFARPNTQDQIFGSDLAEAVGSIHHEIPKKPGDLTPDYSALMADVWSAESKSAERPHIVWSGEGGSVALGHVHLTEKIVALMRGGDIDSAIEEHLERESAQVSPRLFRKGIAGKLRHIINDGIRDELTRLDHNDAARNFYIHLLINDQHRKLAKHFENIDLHRLEFQLPFFDSSLIELLVSMPVDRSLRHELYVKWLSLFPSETTSVPWQVYPGHEPCTVPARGGLDYQWSKEYQTAERAAVKKRLMSQARELLRGDCFPSELLDKNSLRLASLAHSTGMRDYGYLISPAHTFWSYAKKCGGRVEMP